MISVFECFFKIVGLQHIAIHAHCCSGLLVMLLYFVWACSFGFVRGGAAAEYKIMAAAEPDDVTKCLEMTQREAEVTEDINKMIAGKADLPDFPKADEDGNYEEPEEIQPPEKKLKSHSCSGTVSTEVFLFWLVRGCGLF